MKNYIKSVTMIGLLSMSQFVHPDSITDTYNTGDTLTATTLNNIKSAVNDNDSRIDALEAANLNARITALEAALAAHIADLANPHAVTKAQVGLSNLEDIRVNFTATTPPTISDDINSGYSVGSVWIDVTENEAYVLVDGTPNTAVWKLLTNKFYAIGDTGPAGGIVFHIFGGEGRGAATIGPHGLEASIVDQSTAAEWGCFGTTVFAGSNSVGAGAQNTINIDTNCAEPGIAAEITTSFALNGYTDWFLPSLDEAFYLWQQRSVVGGFAAGGYWTSSEVNSNTAWVQSFSDGSQPQVNKNTTVRVRAIRSF
jgi:hypothetical protein